MRNIRIIPAVPFKTIVAHKKVAAYCRVSTQQEIQHHSLEAQRKYFIGLIEQNSNWELIGIYADQTSGRNNVHMRAFQQMMMDCRTGKIDLILVKSISRLGRNTVQFLEACNELNQLRVEVYFEVEKLFISNPKAVKMLTIYAGLYQNESEGKSYSIRWGNTARFQDGSSGLFDRPCYGYRKDETGHLVPESHEAEIIRKIFQWRSEGSSLRTISAKLSEAGTPAPRGEKKWGIETIRKILNNEKYHGNVLLQKTYVANYFSGQQKENHGEYPQYLITGHHEAIV